MLATVDVDDLAEVLDRSIHRLTQRHVEEELPLYVIPVQTPERRSRLLPRLTRLLADQARRQHEAH